MDKNPDPAGIESLIERAKYQGIARHKQAPLMFGIVDGSGASRSDATLCDRDADFSINDMQKIPAMLKRGLMAGLVGHNWLPGIPTVIWSVADNGWIFEGRISNKQTAEYHGYPVRPSEAIAASVYRRFAEWSATNGQAADKRAAIRCKERYGF